MAALVLGPLALWFGVAWIRQGGSFTDSDGQTQPNAVAGCGMLLFGLIACVAAVLMARDVEPKLWAMVLALVGPCLGVRATWRAVAVESIARSLASVRDRLREGHSPQDLDLRGLSAAHSVVRTALRVERPVARTETPDYRSARRQQDPDYVAQVATAVEQMRRSVLRELATGLTPCTMPLFVIALYAATGTTLETLGWQVLAATCGVSALCAACYLLVRSQTTHAADGIRELLAQPSDHAAAEVEPHGLA